MAKSVAQRTNLFTTVIIIFVGQNESEITRLQGLLRAKIPFFL
ncbi:hypothetical protein ENTCAN_06954 [Enterobacter cancerogenus ATCC 35316]|nr:hypothetical protein ENTCAN_06954 [Enterobacter cancerogenus ATCC 35316]